MALPVCTLSECVLTPAIDTDSDFGKKKTPNKRWIELRENKKLKIEV